MSLFTLQKQKAIEPEELMPRPACAEVKTDVAATAQTIDIPIPTDHFIHGMLISIGEEVASADAVLADDLTDISLILNGNNYVKEMTGDMCKAVSIMNKNVMSTGYYMLYFTDPKIPKAKPLPAWLFSSILLRLKDSAPAATMFHYLNVTLFESAGREISGDWALLIEKYLRWKKYGTDTGWMDYDHERAYNVFGYLYTIDDDGTLSDTEYDKLRVIARTKEGEKRIFNETRIDHLKQQDQVEYQNALPTGFVAVEFPAGLPTAKYTSLTSQLNIPTAATNAGLRVLERYCL
ncbi:hypothetical protein ES702_03992 [subsurface metagenome]